MVVVKMDKHGRILIPANIRKTIKADLFVVEVLGDEIRLKPLKTLDLISLFDSIEVDVEDFSDTHKLRKALAEKW